MLKSSYILTISSIIILFVLSLLKLEYKVFEKINFNIKNPQIELNIPTFKLKEDDEPIGKLIINKININHNLYDINNPQNNVDKNITILSGSTSPELKESIIFIAAHSGTGKTAYFKNLDKLNKNDNITLIYKNKKYNYIVKEKWETNKNGYLDIQKENINQLILTTCSPNKKNKQLIINCIKKESN